MVVSPQDDLRPKLVMPEVLQTDYDCEELAACRAIVPLSVIKYS